MTWVVILLVFLLGFVAPYEQAFGARKARRTAEFHLLRGIDFYEENHMEEAMESFMEVMRMGGTAEEAALAREYLNRITLRMSGQPVADSPASKAVQSPKASVPAPAGVIPAAAPASIPQGSPQPSQDNAASSTYLPAVRVSVKTEAEPKPAEPQEAALTPAPETLEEYVQKKFRENRAALIEKMKKKNEVSLVMKGEDKIWAVSLPDGLLFQSGALFQKDSGSLLSDLTEMAYYHPRHLIRIYPGLSGRQSSIQDLQRATVLASYLTGRGLAPERMKVEMEKGPSGTVRTQIPSRDIEGLFADREGRILLVLEELTESFQAHYFFTRYLPRSPVKNDYPTISLGLSREKMDVSAGEGVVVEFFANSNPVAIAHWRLVLKTEGGSVIMAKEGQGTALESIYFDGKNARPSGFEFLPSGVYYFEAEAVNIAGGRVRISKKLEIVGSALPESPKKPVEAAKITEAASPAEEISKKAVRPRKKAQSRKKAASKNVSKKKRKGAAQASGVNPAGAAARAGPAVPTADSGPIEETKNSKQAPVQEGVEIQRAKVEESKLVGEVLTYKISFAANQAVIPERETGTLKQLAEAAKVYPLQRFSLLGFAGPDEKDAAKLAESRVKAVAKILSLKYGIDSGRLNLDSGVGSPGQREVEISVEQ